MHTHQAYACAELRDKVIVDVYVVEATTVMTMTAITLRTLFTPGKQAA
jgi:hypothetical protein